MNECDFGLIMPFIGLNWKNFTRLFWIFCFLFQAVTDFRSGTNYGYDVLDHLTSAKNPTLADEVYSYDATGNRITAANTTGNWQYNTNNQLLNDTVNTYDYDANGSQVKQTNTGTSEVREYLYNLKNRLRSFKVNSTVLANYYYDPFGHRLWKEVNGVRVYALYSQEGLIAEYDSTGVLKQNYGYIPGSTWGTQPLFTSSNGITGYYQLGADPLIRRNHPKNL